MGFSRRQFTREFKLAAVARRRGFHQGSSAGVGGQRTCCIAGGGSFSKVQGMLFLWASDAGRRIGSRLAVRV